MSHLFSQLQRLLIPAHRLIISPRLPADVTEVESRPAEVIFGLNLSAQFIRLKDESVSPLQILLLVVELTDVVENDHLKKSVLFTLGQLQAACEIGRAHV